MPWSIEDVEKHKKGLAEADKKKWVAIANSVLKQCHPLHTTGSPYEGLREPVVFRGSSPFAHAKGCEDAARCTGLRDGMAIRVANSKTGEKSTTSDAGH